MVAANSAAALVLARRLSLLLLKCRILVPPFAATENSFRLSVILSENRYPLFRIMLLLQARVDPGSAPSRLVQTMRKIATAAPSEISVASQRLEISTPSPIGK